MFDFISVSLKCPHCSTSLMDPEKQIDNVPSVKLNIKIGDLYGELWISSIYGSNNYISTIDLKEGAVAEIACPHCKQNLSSDEKCSACEAPLVHVNLEEGGRVNICSREGCTSHSIEFTDLSTTLKHFYKEFKYYQTDDDFLLKKVKIEHLPVIEKAIETIKGGTLLHHFCPHCRTSLHQDDMLKLKVIDAEGKEGFVMLSPYLNVFKHKSTMYTPEGTNPKDIKCWHCNSSLIIDEKLCSKCSSPLAKVNVATSFKFIDFYICSKKGCKWHGLSDEDIKDIMLEDSEEW